MLIFTQTLPSCKSSGIQLSKLHAMAYHKSRSKTHDYRSRCIYLVTIVKAATTPVLSHPFGGLRSATVIPGVRTTSSGDIVKSQLRNIPVKFPEARLLQYVVMPDHLHLVIDIQRPTSYHLGELIATFTGDCTRAAGLDNPFFEPGYHDRILRHKGQLRNMIDYVRDNPRRLIIKREHPEYFSQPQQLLTCGKTYIVYGNFLLLRNPAISAVRISRRFSEQELRARHAEWEETIRGNGVLVSPFISAAEKQVRDEAIAKGGNIILITREEMEDKFKPSGRMFQLCSEGRLLIISTGKAGISATISRSEAMAMNALTEIIASDTRPAFTLLTSKRNNQ